MDFFETKRNVDDVFQVINIIRGPRCKIIKILQTTKLQIIQRFTETYSVKFVYSYHAYNEITLITRHLGIPGKHSIFLFINFTLTAMLHITKSRLKRSNFEAPRY